MSKHFVKIIVSLIYIFMKTYTSKKIYNIIFSLKTKYSIMSFRLCWLLI